MVIIENGHRILLNFGEEETAPQKVFIAETAPLDSCDIPHRAPFSDVEALLLPKPARLQFVGKDLLNDA